MLKKYFVSTVFVLSLFGSAANSAPVIEEKIIINANAAVTPFPHFWEHMFGSGRAILSLRESYRNDLKSTKNIVDLRYVRFHGIFHDEAGVYDEDKDGKPIYNFSYVDQIYDGLLENGVKPFVELSFMPNKLAAHQMFHSFWYKQNVSPPKDWDKWAALMRAFTQHLIDRYGVDEVSTWYFEVWNEPNLDFWGGKPTEETYYKLYDVTANALKNVSQRIRVGGPATAQAAWVDRFIAHCVLTKAPVDFVSTHVYANDTADNVMHSKENIPRTEMVARAAKMVHDQVKASARPDLPIIWSEYNASYANEQMVTDSPYMGPWLANNIRLCDGLVNEMSYWTFSDVFEEQGVVKTPFYGGFGLIAEGGIPKASFNAFKLLHMLGQERIAVDTNSAIVSKKADGNIAVAVWNYAPPHEELTPSQSETLIGPVKKYTITLDNRENFKHARIFVVDKDHGSALSNWQLMNKPNQPSREEQKVLRTSADLAPPIVSDLDVSPDGKSVSVSTMIQPQGLNLIEFVK